MLAKKNDASTNDSTHNWITCCCCCGQQYCKETLVPSYSVNFRLHFNVGIPELTLSFCLSEPNNFYPKSHILCFQPLFVPLFYSTLTQILLWSITTFPWLCLFCLYSRMEMLKSFSLWLRLSISSSLKAECMFFGERHQPNIKSFQLICFLTHLCLFGWSFHASSNTAGIFDFVLNVCRIFLSFK